MAAAATPSVPANNMMGANARRYTAERSIKVRMVCKFSAAQFDSMALTLLHKVYFGKRKFTPNPVGLLSSRVPPMLFPPDVSAEIHSVIGSGENDRPPA